MVKTIFSFLNKEVRGLHEAAYLLGFSAILSQILALVRDRLLAYSFGAGHELDIYYAAFRIPDLIFVSIGSIVSISVLVPFLIEKINKSEKEGKSFIDSTFSLFFILIIVASVLVYIFIPYLASKVFPGFIDSKTLSHLISLSRILLLSPILLGISNFLASITQVHNRFFIYAISPLLYNVGIIFGIIFLYPFFGLLGLGWGVVLGALMHLLIQVPFAISKGLFPRLSFNIDFASIRKVMTLSLPRTLTLSSNQIATFFLIGMASVMTAGSISIFSFSFNLQSVPLSIIGVSYASAVFPALARLFSSGNRDKFIEQMIVSARHIIFLSTPLMVLFVVLRAQIVRVILGAGNFNWSDTRLTAAALAIFSISVVPQGLLMLFVRAYYSKGDTKKPLVINLVSSTLIVVLGYYFITIFNKFPTFHYFTEELFKVSGLSGSVVLMLPLAYSIGVLVNTALHWIAFHKEFKNFTKKISSAIYQSFSASIIMGYVAYIFLNIFDKVFDINTFLGIFSQGLFSGLIGIIVGIIILKLLKSHELSEIWKTLHAKIWKAQVIAPEKEVL
ncbi:MAG: murein biosynthesis integral membrane protein MurJ [Patescibacteria group bacterium]|nr:murein biosynthesis integral membrane protein MurJ [Patescibacteria group bacterium]